MYLMIECPKCGKKRMECDCMKQDEQVNKIEWWHHDCPDSGPTDTAIGEDCNWCPAKSPKEEEKEGSFYGYNEKTDNYYPEVDD